MPENAPASSGAAPANAPVSAPANPSAPANASPAASNQANTAPASPAADNAANAGGAASPAGEAAKTAPETVLDGIKSAKVSPDEADKKTGDAASQAGNDAAHADDADNRPITDWKAVDLKLPADAPVDDQALASFGQAAVDMGLTPAQARRLAAWQLEEISRGQKAWMESQTRELQKMWGDQGPANKQKILALAARVDKVPGCEGFSRALGESGAANNACLLNGLLAIAAMTGEDPTGAGDPAALPDAPETALQGIQDAYRRARAGKL